MRPCVSTGTGDDGTTEVRGDRVSKASERLHVLGILDELNALIGLALSSSDLPDFLQKQLDIIQRTLFILGANLAVASKKSSVQIATHDIEKLEEWGVSLEEQLPPLNKFIMPRGCVLACRLHQARAVCRRTERQVVALAEKEEVSKPVLRYLNRLSDYLFLAARIVNVKAGVQAVEWVPNQRILL